MARPTMDPEQRRTNLLGVRLTAAERAALDARALRDGSSAGDVVRRALAAYLAIPERRQRDRRRGDRRRQR